VNARDITVTNKRDRKVTAPAVLSKKQLITVPVIETKASKAR
jgi:hypothetical protein